MCCKPGTNNRAEVRFLEKRRDALMGVIEAPDRDTLL
jgi:hypothetical protein